MKKILFFAFILSRLACIFAQPAHWQGKIETKNGVIYIHNPHKGLWHDDKSKELKISHIFSIGSLNATDHYLFSWVKDISTDRKGNIYACDSRENRIQVYDRKGKYLCTIGRTGHGPGELMRPMAIALDSLGRIYVHDDLNYRISIFSEDGTFFKCFKFKKHHYANEYLDIDCNGHIFIAHYEGIPRKDTIYPIITKYDTKGNVMKTLGRKILLLKNDGYGHPRFASYGFHFSYDGKLFVNSWYPYQIQIFKNDVLVKVIKCNAHQFTKPKIVEVIYSPTNGPSDKIKAVTERCGVWRLFSLPDGRFFTIITDRGKNYEDNMNNRNFTSYLDLFSKEGYFLKSFLWNWQKYGLIEHVDREGFFYTNRGNSEIVPGVTKWKISFEKL